MCGFAVLPIETCSAAPFWIKYAPKSAGNMPRVVNSLQYSRLLTIPKNSVLDSSY